ncbi:hypothetical protein N1F78_01200 [Seonamhaeicola sp. MEBiC1930]|uniref:hypothetical protein n=1 Tax=Seonamhaeicola sp. MEBiC01930 TaxID=2976768 RepID=UPI00324F5F92
MDSRTIEITKRFQDSWETTQRIFDLFDNSGFEKLKPVKKFIAELKEKGENNHFRIGTSLYRLIISRSIEHGLRDDQKRIMIDTIALNDYEIIFSDGFKKYRQYRISNLNDNRLTKILETLKETLAD